MPLEYLDDVEKPGPSDKYTVIPEKSGQELYLEKQLEIKTNQLYLSITIIIVLLGIIAFHHSVIWVRYLMRYRVKIINKERETQSHAAGISGRD